MNSFKKGLSDGLPICLGYIAVSFAFGLFSVSNGLNFYEATLISAFNMTSAGQFSGVTVMTASGTLIELALSQLVINIRYTLMGISLSQKVDGKFTSLYRGLLGFCITDEIFAVASGQKEAVGKRYFFGLALLPYAGWLLGTFGGALLGNVLPQILVNALGIALYSMLIAIVVPPSRDSFPVLITVLIAIGLSAVIYYTSRYTGISSGFSVIICAVTASVIGAIAFPIEAETEDGI